MRLKVYTFSFYSNTHFSLPDSIHTVFSAFYHIHRHRLLIFYMTISLSGIIVPILGISAISLSFLNHAYVNVWSLKPAFGTKQNSLKDKIVKAWIRMRINVLKKAIGRVEYIVGFIVPLSVKWLSVADHTNNDMFPKMTLSNIQLPTYFNAHAFIINVTSESKTSKVCS